MKAIICDIDGTLADIAHRRHYVATKPKNWRAFNAAMHLDELNRDVAWLVRAMWSYDYLQGDEGAEAQPKIVLASGRGEEQRLVTTDWLLEHDIFPEVTDPNYTYPRFPLFTYERLYMRPAGDNRSDVIVKREILDQIRSDGFDPFMALDDRDGVVAMWREAGLRCLQVAPGNF
jgi:hypothetical protein